MLAVKATEPLPPASGPPVPAARLAGHVPPAFWLRLSAGHGPKGRRWYAWSRLPLDGTGAPDGWGRWLLVRRSLRTGELAYYACAGPGGLPLVALVRVAGTRWRVEEAFQAGKGLCGLDQHQVRRWHCWLKGAQTRTWPLSCWFPPDCSSTLWALSPLRRPSLVLSKLAYLTLYRSFQLLALLARGDAAKDLKILVLRHQLAVLRRQSARPKLGPADRALLAAISRLLPRSRWSCFFVTPRRCCAGTGGSWPERGPTRITGPAGRHWTRLSNS